MKKAIAIVLLAAAIFGIAAGFGERAPAAPSACAAEYLRIHIRADSDDAADQAVKYAVRDAVTEYLTPLVAACEEKEQSLRAVGGALDGVRETAERVLREHGFAYGARVRLAEEQFPTRVYDGVTLPAGVYDALIVELGSGAGDNWWCVVYPPLCFTGGDVSVVYRSKIAEIVRRFFRK